MVDQQWSTIMAKNGMLPATRVEVASHDGGFTARLAPSLDARHNCLLRALPREDYACLAPHLQLVTLELGQVLNEQASELQHVYFPISAILSLQYSLGDGATCEIAGIGSEGVIGASLFMYDSVAPSQSLVQIGGYAYRGAADRMALEFSRGGTFQRLVLRYVQTLFMQVTQTSMCNSRHSVEQRLCRWLLGTLDRGVGSEIVATQERLGEILGVRRESVTGAAGLLQECGAIRYCRGRLTVLDRRLLEPRACECYAVVRQLHARLLHVGSAITRPPRDARTTLTTVRTLRGTRSTGESWSQPVVA
jgi:CRP-like cAMP-binding protein